MTTILGFACLTLLLISMCHKRVLSWAILLSLTWVAGFAEPWTFPLMNSLALVSGIALILANKEEWSGFAGLVTMIFPVMIALDLIYFLTGGSIAWFYYWSLIDLFVFQLLVVGWAAVQCWIGRLRHLGGFHLHAPRVHGVDECRGMT